MAEKEKEKKNEEGNQSPEKAEEDKTSKTSNGEDNQTSKKSDEEKTSKSSKELRSALAQKKHYREKYEKVKDLAQKLQKEVDEGKDEQKEELTDDEWKEKVEFLLNNKDYSKEEFELISSFAKGRGMSLTEAAEDDELEEFIEFKRAKVEQEEKTPGTSFRSGSGSSSTESLLTEEEQKKLDEDKLTEEESRAIDERIISEAKK